MYQKKSQRAAYVSVTKPFFLLFCLQKTLVVLAHRDRPLLDDGVHQHVDAEPLPAHVVEGAAAEEGEQGRQEAAHVEERSS